MNNFIKAISLENNAVEEKDIFFINGLISKKNINFDEDNIKLILDTIKGGHSKIKEMIWKIRSGIMLQNQSTDKIVKCLYFDLKIHNRCKKDKKTRLVTTLITNYYLFLSS